jgi:hypothetical protein
MLRIFEKIADVGGRGAQNSLSPLSSNHLSYMSFYCLFSHTFSVCSYCTSVDSYC